MAFSQDPAYVEWRTTRFPTAPDPTSELNLWHKDLLLVDLWVAEALIPFVDRGIYSTVVPDVFAEIARLRTELERLVGLSVDDDIAVVPAYRDYLDLLEFAYQGFLDAAPK